MKKVAHKKPLGEEGNPPIFHDSREALMVFAEILKRGRLFYPDSDDSSPRHSRVYRIVPLSES
jgi:hypothetical protein